uniref:Uncharacterized protein n=1 Tax=Magallana gigas TaxID=29159 RepID=K1QU32_MAGGI
MNTCYNYLVILSVFWNGFERIEGACTFPTTWDGTWYDSSLTAADVTFNKASLQVTSGWTITAYSSTVSTWTCVDHDSSSNLILFKSVLIFVFIRPCMTTFWHYICTSVFFIYVTEVINMLTCLAHFKTPLDV